MDETGLVEVRQRPRYLKADFQRLRQRLPAAAQGFIQGDGAKILEHQHVPVGGFFQGIHPDDARNRRQGAYHFVFVPQAADIDRRFPLLTVFSTTVVPSRRLALRTRVCRLS